MRHLQAAMRLQMSLLKIPTGGGVQLRRRRQAEWALQALIFLIPPRRQDILQILIAIIAGSATERRTFPAETMPQRGVFLQYKKQT